jgi:hypothetical protein
VVGWQSGHAFACRKTGSSAASEFIGVRIPSPPLNPTFLNISATKLGQQSDALLSELFHASTTLTISKSKNANKISKSQVSNLLTSLNALM